MEDLKPCPFWGEMDAIMRRLAAYEKTVFLTREEALEAMKK